MGEGVGELLRAIVLVVEMAQITPPVGFNLFVLQGLTQREVTWIARTALPGLINEMSLLIKLTPVLAVVGVVDITRAAVRIGAQTYEPLPPFLVALAIYIPIVYALVSVQRWVERRTTLREAAA